MRMHARPGRWLSAALLMILVASSAGLLPAARVAAQGVTSAGEATPGAASNAAAAMMPALPRMIFSDDFEAYGDSSLWNSAPDFPVQSKVVANGSFAAELKNDGGAPVYGRKTLDGSYTRLFMRIRFQVISLGNRPVTLMQFRPSPTRSVVAIRVDAAGHLSYITGATGITATSTVVAAPGAWHELQVLVDTTSDTGNIRLWLDQAELTTLRQNAWLGHDKIHVIDLGDNSSSQHSDIAYDDVAVDTSFISSDRSADPVPGVLVAHALPNWGGIVFELDGKRFVTDEHGVATIVVDRWSTDLRSRIAVHDDHQPDGSVASFTNWQRWKDAHSVEVYATFRISEPVSFSFVDMAGVAVDPTLIDTLVLKSKAGDIVTLSGSQLAGATLPTTTVINSPKGLATKSTEYMVDQVIIGGSNVVNRAQQRSTFETSRHWTVSLLFYGVTFQARDALFGTPLGKSIVVKAADGSTQNLALDANGEATIPRLPRGEFSVSVVGAGYSPPRPITVSRDQVVDLKVISPLDVLLVLSLMGIAVVGLVLIGRPFLVTNPARYVWSTVGTARLRLERGVRR